MRLLPGPRRRVGGRVGCGEAVDEVGVGGGNGEVGDAGEGEEEDAGCGAGLSKVSQSCFFYMSRFSVHARGRVFVFFERARSAGEQRGAK